MSKLSVVCILGLLMASCLVISNVPSYKITSTAYDTIDSFNYMKWEKPLVVDIVLDIILDTTYVKQREDVKLLTEYSSIDNSIN